MPYCRVSSAVADLNTQIGAAARDGFNGECVGCGMKDIGIGNRPEESQVLVQEAIRLHTDRAWTNRRLRQHHPQAATQCQYEDREQNKTWPEALARFPCLIWDA